MCVCCDVEDLLGCSNALELVHYWNDYPGEAAESDDDDDDERRTNAAAQHLLVEGGRKVACRGVCHRRASPFLPLSLSLSPSLLGVVGRRVTRSVQCQWRVLCQTQSHSKHESLPI